MQGQHLSLTRDTDFGLDAHNDLMLLTRGAYMQTGECPHLKKLSFSATTVKPVAWERSSVLLLTRLPVFSRYST